MTPREIERIRDIIAKLRHPMANEQGFHVGKFCQPEREEAAAILQSILPAEGNTDGSAG